MYSQFPIRGSSFRLARLAAALFLLPAMGVAQSHDPKDLAVGKLLVARAPVPDGRFRHAVVLLVGLSSQGEAAGLVLNRPGSTPLSRLFPGVTSAKGRSDAAYSGGPVDSSRIFCLLHLTGPLHEASTVLPGVYISDKVSLMHMALNAREPASSFRVFQGYAGWSPGQLPRELAAGLWTITPASIQLIFDHDPATLWARLSAPAVSRPAGVQPHLPARR